MASPQNRNARPIAIPGRVIAQLLYNAGVVRIVTRPLLLIALLGVMAGAFCARSAPASPPGVSPAESAPRPDVTPLAPTEIIWQPTTDSLAATVPKQRLSRILPRLARATGWQVFLEPGTDPEVSCTFRTLPAPAALERLLGGHSFSLRTGKDGRSRLLIYRTTANDATEEVEPEYEVIERVANELLIRLKPTATHTIEQVADLLGGKVVGKIEGLDIYRLRFPNEAATQRARASLADNPDIAAGGDNLLLRGPNPGEQTQVGAAGGGGLSLKPARIDKSNLIVGLIDTAIRPLGKDFDGFVLPPQSVVGPAPDGSDLTHGTAMLANILHGAQITLGAGQEAAFRVLPVNVYRADEGQGRANLFDVLNGTQLAIQQGASIINWSLSSPEPSPLVTDFTRYYASQGVTFLAAAGNQPVTQNMYPAADPSVVAITALGRDGNYASYANRGNFIDVGLPGSDMVNFGAQRYLIQGTSTATAFGSGIVAARSQLTGVPPAQAVNWLITAFPPPGKK